jgi:hypothetical protein
MSVNLSPVGNAFQFFSNDGLPLNAGKIFTYQAGSTTPLATYTDPSGLIANTNPIILGTDGRPPSTIWLSDSFFYKFVLTDASDVVIQTYDNLYGIIGTIPTVAPASLPAGCILLWSGSIGSIPAGFVLCNGLNGTPDLRNRFVVGAGSTYAVDASGGSADAIVVSHSHTTSASGTYKNGYLATVNSTSSASGNVNPTSIPENGTDSTPVYVGGTDGAGAYLQFANSNATATVNTTGTAATTGVSGTNANLPPYYALCYIMKT